jgi:replicative DNA helicase
MLLSRDAIAAAVEICAADDFYKPAHGHVFEAVCSLYGQGEPVDPVTVADELRRADLLEAIGGTATLISLQANTPATANAGRYARIVEEHALLRGLIGVASEIAELGYSVPDDVANVLDRAESMVFEVAERRVTDTLKPLHDLLSESLDRLEALYDRGEAITGVPTGYVDLDERLSGLQPSNLVIVGARPAMGKTSFALGIASHAAMEARAPVLYFSLEMSHAELTQRLLCSEARVDSSRVRNGRLLESDWPKISHAIGRLAEAPIYIDDNPNLTVMEVRAKARRLKSRLGELGVIIVDYLQLMSGRNRAENRQVEVSEISRGLKILARELEVPVIALSQLSRNLEMRSDKRPVLADLRESGCMPASTRILRADNGQEITLGELVLTQEQPLVWSLDDDWRLTPQRLLKTFPTGIKPVFRLRLASGLEVEATANHPFRTVTGWTRLDELACGAFIAVAPPGDGLRGSEWIPPHQVSRPGQSNVTTATLESPELAALASSDVFWDEVVEITPLGEMPTFDVTVDVTHNFVANGIVAHNSLEQDSDIVMFLYRDDVYNPESQDRGTAEVIVSKHRNGPTGVTQLAFLDHYTRFANMARV